MSAYISLNYFFKKKLKNQIRKISIISVILLQDNLTAPKALPSAKKKFAYLWASYKYASNSI
ncbi:hypothetical protein ABIE50_000955 [Chitinophaga sp. OAE865]